MTLSTWGTGLFFFSVFHVSQGLLYDHSPVPFSPFSCVRKMTYNVTDTDWEYRTYTTPTASSNMHGRHVIVPQVLTDGLRPPTVGVPSNVTRHGGRTSCRVGVVSPGEPSGSRSPSSVLAGKLLPRYQ